MKRFIINVFLFVLPFSILIIELILPINYFTYRPWEALLYSSKTGIAFPFYPNQHLKMNAVGDLAHHTKYSVLKKEDWITDELGYRNNTFIKKPKILLIGDSFITGTGLTQDSTITNILMNKLNIDVYNLAPSNFNDFISLLNNKKIEKPKLVIFSMVERNIPDPINIQSREKIIIQNGSKISILKDKLLRMYSIKFLKARINKSTGSGIKGEVDPTMFFFKGKNQEYHQNKIKEISKTIFSYKKFCDSLGMNFIFLPLPNKETVYFDKVPLSNKPDFINRLNFILEKKGVTTVNTIELFGNKLKNKNLLLYHLDDTHWNSNGVKITADELIRILRSKKHNRFKL